MMNVIKYLCIMFFTVLSVVSSRRTSHMRRVAYDTIVHALHRNVHNELGHLDTKKGKCGFILSEIDSLKQEASRLTWMSDWSGFIERVATLVEDIPVCEKEARDAVNSKVELCKVNVDEILKKGGSDTFSGYLIKLIESKKTTQDPSYAMNQIETAVSNLVDWCL